MSNNTNGNNNFINVENLKNLFQILKRLYNLILTIKIQLNFLALVLKKIYPPIPVERWKVSKITLFYVVQFPRVDRSCLCMKLIQKGYF